MTALLTRIDLSAVDTVDIPKMLASYGTSSGIHAAAGEASDLYRDVASIITTVRQGGDAALREFSLQFDGIAPEHLRVPQEKIKAALASLPVELSQALYLAYERLFDYHHYEASTESISPPSSGMHPDDISLGMPMAGDMYVNNGIEVRVWRRAVGRAGIYSPGGKARYPSSVLMCVAAARSAGVREIVLCTPPTADGFPAVETLAAAAIAGVDEVYSVGGAQAIAAMAYGTETISPVDVITGPGNRYVAEAKRQLSGVVGIPSAYAGPSEVVIVADDSAPAEWVAADLAVQAEHGPDGLSWLIAWDPIVLDAVEQELSRIVESSTRIDDIRATLLGNGYSVLVKGAEGAAAVSNVIAPEHLELMCSDADRMVGLFQSAGAVFIGSYSAAAFGDYLAGPNHVLPTARTARFSSALGARDFIKVMHAIKITPNAAREFADPVAVIAEAEQLPTHGIAARMRAGDDSDAPSSVYGHSQPSHTGSVVPMRDDLTQFSPYSSLHFDAEVKINANEYPYSLPDDWRAAIADRIKTLEFNRYPEIRSVTLRHELAGWLGVDMQSIFVGRGSNEVLQCLSLAYGGHGRHALVFEPTYQMHSRIARVAQTSVISVPRRDDFIVDIDRMAENIERYNPHLIFLCSPNNPTGIVESRDVIETALRLSSGLVILDAAYAEFASTPIYDIDSEYRDRLVIVRTFSKVWAMASLRIGFMVAHPDIVEACGMVALPYNLDSLSQELGRIALSHVDELQDRVDMIVRERERVFNDMRKWNVQLWPSEANFILFRPLNIASDKFMDAMVARSILVRDFSQQPLLEGCFRATIGTVEENNRFLEAFAEAMEVA